MKHEFNKHLIKTIVNFQIKQIRLCCLERVSNHTLKLIKTTSNKMAIDSLLSACRP